MTAYLLGAERQDFIMHMVGKGENEKVYAAWDEFRNSFTLAELLKAYSEYRGVIREYNPLRFLLAEPTHHVSSAVTYVPDCEYRFIMADEFAEALREVLPKEVRVTTDEGGIELSAAENLGSIRRRAVLAVLRNDFRQYRYGHFQVNDFSIHTAVALFETTQQFTATFTENYHRQLREAMGRNRSEVKPVPTHDTSGNLRAFMSNVKGGMTIESNPIEKLPVLEHGTKSSRTWGIEVEAGGARGVEAPAYWDRKYDGSLVSAYDDGERYIDPEDCYYAENHREYIDEERWLEVGDEDPDGNIVEEGQEGYFMFYEVENPDYQDPSYCDDCGMQYDSGDNDDDTGEFVSPILHSFHSRGLENLLSELVEQPQNDSAGIHVHVGADGLTPKQIGSLVFAYQIVEPLIEGSYFRRTRSYCKVRNEEEFTRIMHDSKRVQHLTYTEALNSGKGDYLFSGNRYVSLNLCALEDHGTVEFRAMGPKYDSYEHLVKWALFCREMVNVAASNVPVRVWAAVRSFDDVIAIFRAYGKEMNDGLVDNELRELLEEELEEA